MTPLLVVPARHASSRFPGKPLVALRGATGEARSLVRRAWEAAVATGLGRVVVATEDGRIREHCEGFGAEVVMTAATCRNGTERVAEAAALLGWDGIVVNLQGDAPLTPPWFLGALVEALARDARGAAMATPVLRMDGATLRAFREDRRAGRVGGTTAVRDAEGRALYFSKEVVPHAAHDYGAVEPTPVLHHVGAYAYRPWALESYLSWDPGPLEELEGLEQLRFLENGADVLCVEVEARGRAFWEVNNPEDVPRVEAMMRAMGMA